MRALVTTHNCRIVELLQTGWTERPYDNTMWQASYACLLFRLNTSLLVDYCHDDGTHKYILVDIGKTFREQVLRWFVHHKVPYVDSVRYSTVHSFLKKIRILGTKRVLCSADHSDSWACRCCVRPWRSLGGTTKKWRKRCRANSYLPHTIHDGQVHLHLQLSQ